MLLALDCRRDNMSAIVVAFPAAQYGEGEGVAQRVREREEREAREADESPERVLTLADTGGEAA